MPVSHGFFLPDRINVQCCLLAGLGQSAVFAAVLRPLNDVTPQMRQTNHALT
jgi:hypothetical protein